MTKKIMDLQDSRFVRYRASGVKHTRLIKVVKTAEDPLQPPKFSYKRIPRGGRDSPPPVVLQSPPRPLTAEDQKNWRVPPCVSLWKNPKGYAIPLDKRHAAAVAWEAEINHRIAELAEALHVAEAAAREGVALRSKIRREWEMREKERRDEEFLELARRARDGISGGRERKKRRAEGGEGTKTKKKKSRGGGGLPASAKGELLFDRSLVGVYAHGDGDGDGDGDEVKMTKMKVRERFIEFERENPDPFGLDEFLSKLNH